MEPIEDPIQKIHSISSDVRTKSRGSISAFQGVKRERLKFEKYLVGRSYQLFRGSIRAQATVVFYNRNLYYFCDFIGKSTEQLVNDHGSFKKVNGKSRPNTDGTQELQREVENYVLSLQERVGRNEIKASTCVARIPAIRLFCEMNEITLNWKKIGRLLPSTDLVADDEAYTREQIRKMLDFCDLRTKIIVLFLATSGIRLGGLAALKVGDLEPLYSENKSLLAAHVKVYSGTRARHDTFVTPEAWDALSEYLSLREKFGERIAPTSPLLLSRFSRKTLSEGRAKPIDPSTIQNLLASVRDKADINKKSTSYNGRFTIKTVHAFRKFFNTTLKSVKNKDGQPLISFVNKERLLGHTLVDEHKLEDNYDRSDRVSELLQDYVKAVPSLTFSNEGRLRLDLQEREKEVSNLKNVQIESSNKDNEFLRMKEQYEVRIGWLEKIVQSLKLHVENELVPIARASIDETLGDVH